MTTTPGGPADLPVFDPAPATSTTSTTSTTGAVPAAPAPAQPSPYVGAHVRQIMGMPISLQLRGPRARSEEAAQWAERAFADLTWVDETFSKWKPDSELSRLRRGEITVEQCCPEMAEVLALCEGFREETDGAFTPVLPDEETGEWLVDPTGLVKGWAIARAAAILAGFEGHAHCVNAGGDIAVGGVDTSPEGDRPWRLAIENPDDRSQLAAVIELREGALATSGCAARGAHLVDPTTGERRWVRGSVSVIAPDVISADVWATALFVGPRELEQRIAGCDGWEVVRL